jgi:hypothetical protein
MVVKANNLLDDLQRSDLTTLPDGPSACLHPQASHHLSEFRNSYSNSSALYCAAHVSQSSSRQALAFECFAQPTVALRFGIHLFLPFLQHR